MRLLGVNAGKIRPQVIDGVVVNTAYLKTPVPQPWVITPTGAEGDEVAVHTDHLYAFDRDAYDYWARELGAVRETWGDGHFAENLTLDRIDQTELHIGDRFAVGTAVIVVTGPRVPCWKLTWRLGQPKTFMRRFRLSGRSGAYFGVIEPGVVAPGDELVPIAVDPTSPTVAQLSNLCDSGTRITPDQLGVIDRAMACTDLSETVRGTLGLKLANLARDSEQAPGWNGWRRFQIDHTVAETADIASYVLRPDDGGQLPGFRAGQHVVVRMAGSDGQPVVRTWSLSAYDPDPSSYRISVKARPGGRGSIALARSAAEGAAVELRAPAGRFHLDRGAFRPVVLIAAGIGITPMIAMIQAHLDRSMHIPPLWILYGSPTRADTAFVEQLEEMVAQHRDLHLHYFHSRSHTSSEPAAAPHPDAERVRVHHGRLTPARVVEVMQGNYLRIPDDSTPLIPWFESDIYLCGSPGFTEALCAGLVDAGANPDLVFAEDFAAAAQTPAGPRRSADARIDFGPRRVRATWVAAREQTLLELAEENGLELPFDCRAGTCRTCESRLLLGDVEGSVTEDADGGRRALLCVSYPASDEVVIEVTD